MGLIYNNKEIWEDTSSGEVMYQIPSGYDGIFLSTNLNAPDINKFKSISGSNIITLSKSIADCDNGILINLSSQVAEWNTSGYEWKDTFVPNPAVSPQKMLIKKGSPTASMTYGWYAGNNTLTSTGNVSVSGNQMKVTTDSEAGMFAQIGEGDHIFWVITSIVSY
ncbi:hypothetical protein [Levilactobacillus brevis]|uniref:hypothetical protein n=1 Tax=Levilactobacillus brevis TaxID=1580 RepID=UPI000BE79422|nr:hypothetical protein [Levilactobacillus brevis]MCP9614882.1 hypothetical protein [Levilactobacillus brevis]MCZ2120493.1 hypothetical protein [Levilactobacillus brevis]MCZ2125981.1 hypothetical protein [Levilactobacillus brevis]MCZ2210307.1 hypothetical protein [Levilactobacillus brevis]MCZ2325773.1 hypothetical protein [Levilactobacillus brevis]